ncbi:Cytochrome b/c1 [Planctomycetes bacterium Pan216]|uniref:Cytochrome b/c1 n=1 Tax=Kolteria novifilia TaxID=2527975 RepID=A0A518BAD0_9BACT|nr:Cytochrome b/c1 [Planctomycetes bacterium Pan216]
MKRGWVLQTLNWFEHRLGMRDQVLEALNHPVPKNTGWWYVFGSASVTLLTIQLLTGVLLTMVYVPTPDLAYQTIEYISYEQFLGWYVRAVHSWSGNAMMVMVLLHMTQVYLWGAYKYPRELTWVVGCFLFVFLLGFLFSGQVLRFDSSSYWGIGVGAAMAGRVPLIGPALVHLLLGGETIGGETLSRFYALHVFVLPALLLGFLGIHLLLVMRQGVSAPPFPAKRTDKETYDKVYERELAEGEPFAPDPLAKDVIFSALIVLVVFVLAAVYGVGLNELPADPTIINANPRPDWPFLPLFALLSLCPPWMETFVILVLPVAGFAFLVSIPFVSGTGERSPWRRPVGTIGVVVGVVLMIVLGWLGAVAPWSPAMEAWSGTPIPERMVESLSPTQLVGAVVFQNKNCRNCHALDGQGGTRGPDLTTVATRLTKEELVRQVVQGGGNMPAYGKQLSSANVEALVAFLATLHPEGIAPAKPSVEPITGPLAGGDNAKDDKTEVARDQ